MKASRQLDEPLAAQGGRSFALGYFKQIETDQRGYFLSKLLVKACRAAVLADWRGLCAIRGAMVSSVAPHVRHKLGLRPRATAR